MADSKPQGILDELPALQRYARSLMRSEDRADDLVHDALVSALANSRRYEPGRPLRVWLFSILHNVFVSGLRHQEVQERHRATVARAADNFEAPQETTLRLLQLERALEGLSEDQRAALHLVAVEELSYQDAAAALGIPIGTLISRISRARARLREIEGDEQVREQPGNKLRLVGTDR